MQGYVYILQSLKNQRFYIGSTIDLKNRFLEHQNGEVLATRYLRPLKLVFSQCFDDIKKARETEAKLKKYKSRKIIQDIISFSINSKNFLLHRKV